MIKEQDVGERAADVCRRYGLSEGTFDIFKSKCGGMEPLDAKKLRAPETENARLIKPSIRSMATTCGCHLSRPLNPPKRIIQLSVTRSHIMPMFGLCRADPNNLLRC